MNRGYIYSWRIETSAKRAWIGRRKRYSGATGFRNCFVCLLSIRAKSDSWGCASCCVASIVSISNILRLLSAYTFPPRTPRASLLCFLSIPLPIFRSISKISKFHGWIYRPFIHVYPSLSRILNPLNCSTFTFENFLSKIFDQRYIIFGKIKKREKHYEGIAIKIKISLKKKMEEYSTTKSYIYMYESYQK